MKSNQKTCNKELLQDTVLKTKEKAADVRSAVDFYSRFIAETMKAGAFETVMVPYMGKFQPKTKEIQWKMHRKGLPRPETAPTIEEEDDDQPVQDN